MYFLYECYERNKLAAWTADVRSKTNFAALARKKYKQVKKIEAQQNVLKIIANDPEAAFYYAYWILRAPFPEGEAAIATSASYSQSYARLVLNGPFPAGEAAIATSVHNSVWYAEDTLKGPFPAGEAVIATDPYYAVRYACKVLNKRFPAGEAIISTSGYHSSEYAKHFGLKILISFE